MRRGKKWSFVKEWSNGIFYWNGLSINEMKREKTRSRCRASLREIEPNWIWSTVHTRTKTMPWSTGLMLTNSQYASLSSLVSVGGMDAQYLSFDAELEEERSSKLLSNALVLTPMNSPRRKPAKENEVDGEANFNQFREINDQKVRVRALISNQYLAFRFMYVWGKLRES